MNKTGSMCPFKFSPYISKHIQDSIIFMLRELEKTNDVRVIFAVESGSRAWGFPSPDSDYDVRFVYARPSDWYLSITPGRDVIELPIENDLDVNGWDIRKALGLLIKPNPVLLEWLSSPIHYIWDDTCCGLLMALSRKIAHGHACLHHYLHLGSRQWDVYIGRNERVNLKKYFYVVRPAMTIRWVRMYPDKVPPMNFQDLIAGIDTGEALGNALGELLQAKNCSKEMGEAPRIAVIDNFIKSEFAWAREAIKGTKPCKHDFSVEANSVFRAIIHAS
jgi:uncharacterized protein